MRPPETLATVTSAPPTGGDSAAWSSVLAQLRDVAARTPRAIALEDRDLRVTYSALLARVAHLRHVLLKQGVQVGDRVLFAVRPSYTAIALTLALTDCGAVIVAAPVGAGDAVFRAQMQLLQPQWAIAESVLFAAMRSELVRRVVAWRGGLLPSLGALRGTRMIASGPWLPGLGGIPRLSRLERDVPDAAAAASDTARETDPAADAFIVFTSGTTAAPKAVVHSRRSLAVTLTLIRDRLALTAGDRLYARDLHLVLPALLAGATAVLPARGAFVARRMLEDLRRGHITHLFEVTANLEQLVQQLENTQTTLPDSVRFVMVGAAPVRRAFFTRLRAVLPAGADAWCVYGMTEILPVAAISVEEKLAFGEDGDIVGAPVTGAGVSLSDEGELIVAGDHLFSRYLGQPDVRVHATGDLARLDERGRIVLMGRAKDMIIRREYNIYPELHEPVIERIDGVARCAMVGVFDERRADERVVLVVEPTERVALHHSGQRDALTSHIARELREGAHRIDDTALPDVIIIATLPRSGRSHKVDKTAVRALAQEHLR